MIIKGGRVVDGTGSPWFRADIRIVDGKVAEFGLLEPAEGEKVVNASGLVVAPGFIDAHSHSDSSLLINGRAESKVRQGVTTEINGSCGFSLAPNLGKDLEFPGISISRKGSVVRDWSTFGQYLARLERQGVSINSAFFVGHNTVRLAVMGAAQRSPTEEELAKMCKLVEQSMQEGAIGLSSGLEYVPGRFSDTGELIELAKAAAKYGGIYATHQRNRDIFYEKATEEAIEIGRVAGLRVQLSHFSVRFPGGGKTKGLLSMVENARRRGIEVNCDVIVPNDAPRSRHLVLRGGYHWAAQSLARHLIPPAVMEKGVEEVLRLLKMAEMREKWSEEFVPMWKLFGIAPDTVPEIPEGVDPRWDLIIINHCRANPEGIGMTLEEIGQARNVDPRDAAYQLLLEEGEATGGFHIPILGASTAEADSIQVMLHPTASFSSDRAALAPYGELAEQGDPNSYGPFPRVFRKYVRGTGLLTLEEAVRKMTAVPASQHGLGDRGVLRVGAWADIVVFDEEQIADNATIEDYRRYPDGIPYVLVNGKLVVEDGEHTGAMPGMVLRGPTCR